jgi:hypothetical protein
VLQWLPWTDAAAGAGVGLVATLGLAHRRRRVMRAAATWGRELTAMFALYALWQYAGDLSVSQGGGAGERGRDIWRAERSVGLPSEVATQRLVLHHHDLIRLANVYYAQAHVAVLGLCLVWLFARHRARYPAVRNVLVLVTAASLLIQLLPVAPPRLIPSLGVVDTGHLIGPSVYPASVAPGLDQLSAMPSLHIGWAVVVAGSVIYALRSPWRWLAVGYPVLTWFVVVVTGNHYWADGLVAIALCAAAAGVVRLATRPRGRRRTNEHPPDRAPELVYDCDPQRGDGRDDELAPSAPASGRPARTRLGWIRPGCRRAAGAIRRDRSTC